MDVYPSDLSVVESHSKATWGLKRALMTLVRILTDPLTVDGQKKGRDKAARCVS